MICLVNLGQGFPNFPAPSFVKQAAMSAIGYLKLFL